jgi:hypothetical protein
MRKLIVAAVAATSLIAIQAAPASAETFKGDCSFTGIAKFDSPLTSTKAPNKYHFKSGAPGSNFPGGDKDASTCKGTLNGKSVDTPPGALKAFVDGPGNLSCAQSESTAPGVGAIVFPTGETFPFTFTFTGTLTEVSFTATDGAGNANPGKASFAKWAPPTTPVDCGNGTGVKQLGFDASATGGIFQSSTAPAASSGSGGGGSSGGGGGGSNTSSGSSGTGSSGTSGTSPSKTKKSKAKCKKGKKGKKGKCKKAKK